MNATANSSKTLTPIRLVSIGVIAYNEEGVLEGLLDDIVAQDYPHESIEVVLVDSASTDNTKTLMNRFARSNSAPGKGFADVQVLDNPKRIIPSGWNVALSAFTGDAFIRVDAHARIPSDFVSQNVAVLEEGEFVCGGPRPTVAKPDTPWTRTLLAAEESAFGSSIADYRQGTEKQYVSAVFLPAFRREVIETVGLYDERLERTEDNDYCYRVREAGYKIRFDSRIHSTQIARNSFARMMRQKYGNGYWVGKTLFIQPKCLHVYHFAPLAFVVGAATMLLVGAFASWWPFLACTAAYVLICAALTARTIVQSAKKCVQMLALPVVYAGIHFAYGAGTVAGIASGLMNLRGAK
ncbi:MAG: glycosyltransferase family 2 protein [Eggerthellaceae bacterium]|nr:glycosyltransferase family 2 protein [Eggerthellaceae bacterium]